MVQRHRYVYGADPSQWGELFLPDLPDGGTRQGVVVIIHGGYWRARYGAELGEPLAADLAAHGIAAWNLEYRRAGNGGGWPFTFRDILAGIDKLQELAGAHALDLGKVVALGHSAGGHLAVWAAGRDRLAQLGLAAEHRAVGANPGGANPVGANPGGANPVGANPGGANPVGANPGGVRLTGVVSQSGVLNLAEAEELNLSDGAVANLLGGPSSDFPGRHRYADPMAALPLSVPVLAVHATNDADVPPGMSISYVEGSRSGPVPAQLVMVPGDHFALIDPAAEAYQACRQLVAELLG